MQYSPCRNALYDRFCWHVPDYACSGSDEGPWSDGETLEDRAVGPEGCFLTRLDCPTDSDQRVHRDEIAE